MLSFNGAEVVINTRNSVNYRKFYDDQRDKFIKAYDEAASQRGGEDEFEGSEYSKLFHTTVPIVPNKEDVYTVKEIKGIENVDNPFLE